MKRIRIIVIAIASLVLIGHLSEMNYNDFSWSANGSSYLGIIAMSCIILSMILAGRSESKESQEG